MAITKKNGEGRVRQAVILAGGMGIRLRPYTYDKPKLMVEVNGRPFFCYLLDELKKNGIEEVVFLLGYLPEKVQEYFGDGSKHGLKIRYSIGPADDSTGTRVRKAKDLLRERFLLMYCDNFIHLDLEKLHDFHVQKNALMTKVVYTNRYGFTKNNVLVDNDGNVLIYDKSRTKPDLNGVDLGFFIVEKEIVSRMPARDFWLYELFPALIAEKKLAGFTTNNLYYSLSTPERMKLTERFFTPRKVIFLDRDGVINKKMPRGEYVTKWAEFEFLPGAKDAMKILTDADYETYIISNQAGIGRGLMRDSDLFEIHKNMEKELGEYGVRISAIYYCPHRSEDNCLCRKPKPGMLFRAALDHQIDLPSAVFVGDDPRDIEAGNAAGCRTILLKEGKTLLEAVKSLVNS
ncbi:MAG: hypothetical protein A3B25_03255 [Candidatus Ryanbacteria bacterium RIFCSPLOWO2_01_FULL_48_26]|uniref:D,D-heptose 1,7-bisphosphate phosphatase n=1 Tax=Candidatus Ryanbacteria bacterium RIFCSPLOWO2_01_FULL_48_26 TaxID=1802126 RepID=A0A1G2GSC4_9BACT|nr:MAG: hypothetical protein A3B25_03255 [Candidatus Ryanbacteria bacterium RIFCSPLOWO2_01_FULL_48_26]